MQNSLLYKAPIDISTPIFRTKSLPQTVADDVLPPVQNFWSRVWKRPVLMHYHRFAFALILANMLFLFFGLRSLHDVQALGDLALMNLAVALLIRQPYVINFFVDLAARAPLSWPLGLRWSLGKIYHIGGLNLGGLICGVAWHALAVYMMCSHSISGEVHFSTVLSCLRLPILLALCLTNLAPIRLRYHDLFERTTRLGGWLSLMLLTIQTGLDLTALYSWQTGLLLILFFNAALPWMRLKKVAVQYVKPSSHMVFAKLDYGLTPKVGSTVVVSRSPLVEWHPFASVPTPGKSGYRLAISRAGDWTSALIDQLPSHLWVKSIPTASVGRISPLFKRVVYVATGSGIGPCLAYLLAQNVPCKLVWSTRDPRKTYGDDMVDEILSVQDNPVIWDTDKQGKPDMVRLAYEAYKQFDAEAVICIANRKLTWEVVYGLESRGIPAYGAIWDS